ncbi:MAG: hypothetical protein JSR77_17615, partial [Planctomycetes bacterium]|nr:hypothetical protein [Planctomycetota bacterium]
MDESHRERFVGMCLRATHNSPSYLANNHFLLRSVPLVVSVDVRVLPPINDSEGCHNVGVRVAPMVTGASVGVRTESSLDILSWLQHHPLPSQEMLMLGLSVMNASNDPNVEVWSSASGEPIPETTIVQTALPVIGYDIASLGGLSFLLNCGYDDAERSVALQTSWARSINS